MSGDWCFGIHSVQALLSQPHSRVKTLYLADERQDKRLKLLQQLAQDQRIRWQAMDSHAFKQLLVRNGLSEVRHQGVLAYCHALHLWQEADLPDLLTQARAAPLVLVLDEISDPHNLGACLRTADAAGVTAVILPKQNSAPLSSAVVKVACGAAQTVPLIYVANLNRTLTWLGQQGLWIIGTAGDTDNSLYGCDFRQGTVLVMGSEGSGLRRLTRERCDQLVSLPMLGQVSSLNVSVASGICLYEALRQRQAAQEH